MRIIIALHQYFPDFSAGTEVLADRVARGLMARGHEVMVFAGHPARDGHADTERFVWDTYDGISVLRFLHQHRPMGEQDDVVRQEYDSRLVADRFGALLDEWAPDLVHFFNFARISTAPAACCLARHVPFFYTATDFWPVCTTARLQLEDGRSCSGPELGAWNCIAHLLEIKRSCVAPLTRYVPGPFRWLIGAVRASGKNAGRVGRMLISADERKQVIRTRLNQANAVWVPTLLMRRVLQEHGYDPGVLRVLPYGVERKGLTRRLRSLSIARELQVGFIGTIAFHKGLHDLVQAMFLLRGEKISLRVFGDETQFPEYVGTFRDVFDADERMRFEGCFRKEEIGEVIDRLDVLVVPSVWRENSPLVVLEALARACPVLASRQDGMLEFIVDGENGLLFEPGVPLSLAQSLSRLRSEEGLLEKLSAGCDSLMDLDGYLDEMEATYSLSFSS